MTGGLAFTLANLTAIFLGECINFTLQRNVTFKSRGPLAPQLAMHFLATVVTGGVAMVIIFAVDNKIFAPGFGEEKNKHT